METSIEMFVFHASSFITEIYSKGCTNRKALVEFYVGFNIKPGQDISRHY